MKDELNRKLAFLSQGEHLKAVCGIVRGIERETLRVAKDGAISQTDHPVAFGSALTHPYITTDYSEALLEFITPASTDANKTMAQLEDIHRFAVKNLGDEVLWPLSMPCYIDKEEDIRLAYYGESNSGKMKHLYREGLRFRYGSFMQTISGIHFNLSFPEPLFKALAQYDGQSETSQDFQSAQYLGLIRNFKRYVWLLTYLYGASPALCGSFIKGAGKKYPFEQVGPGSLYLPYATSLRLSDLGYTSNEQSSLKISYNNIDEYVSGLRNAIHTPVERYQIPADNPNGYAQLNNNLLQIENEYYSPVRPKRTTRSGEKPTDALADRGIEYIEIRSMDVNPYSPVGIELSQIHFLDVLLSYCLLKPSPDIDDGQNAVLHENMTKVILRGREPGLTLTDGDKQVTLVQWGKAVFDELLSVAQWLDKAGDTEIYTNVVLTQRKALDDPELTLSARFLNELKRDNIGSGGWAVSHAAQYKAHFEQAQPKHFCDEHMREQASSSLQRQKAIEQADDVDFDTFLANYFAD